MIEAARKRLAGRGNLRFCSADMHELPLDDASFDQVLLMNVLTYSERPGRAVSEAARVLRPGGKLAIVSLSEHAHAAVTRAYGHVRAGFSPAALKKTMRAAGLSVDSCAITSRERRKPHFEVVTACGSKVK
jgi:ubiquinone/menaquinone biosynthesis C-methylase UbiE